MTSPLALLAKRPPLIPSRIPAFRYDPALQLNVAECGTAVIDLDRAELSNPTYTVNESGTKKDDDWATPPVANVSPKAMLFGPTMTHNSSGLKQDDA